MPFGAGSPCPTSGKAAVDALEPGWIESCCTVHNAIPQSRFSSIAKTAGTALGLSSHHSNTWELRPARLPNFLSSLICDPDISGGDTDIFMELWEKCFPGNQLLRNRRPDIPRLLSAPASPSAHPGNNNIYPLIWHDILRMCRWIASTRIFQRTGLRIKPIYRVPSVDRESCEPRHEGEHNPRSLSLTERN